MRRRGMRSGRRCGGTRRRDYGRSSPKKVVASVDSADGAVYSVDMTTAADAFNAAVVDPISAEFVRFAGSAPREGDHYSEAPEHHLDRQTGDLVAVTRC